MALPIFPFPIDWSAATTKRWTFDARETTLGFGAEFIEDVGQPVLRGYEFSVYLPDAAAVRAWEAWWQLRAVQGHTFRLAHLRSQDEDPVYLAVRLAGEKIDLRWLAVNRVVCRVRVIEIPAGEEPEEVEEETLWLYRFSGLDGVVRYTSHQAAVWFAGEEWLPAAINHNSLRESLAGARNQLKIETSLFAGNPLAARVPFARPDSLRVQVYRFRRGALENELLYQGRVGSVSLEGNKLTADCTTERPIFESQFPQFFVQNRCNHVLYSTACGVARTGFDASGTITNLVRNRVVVTGGGITGKPANYYAGGYVEVGDEKMSVVSSSGANIFLSAPLRRADIGDAIVAYAGCAKTEGNCKDKFNNFPRFGGHPRVPRENLTMKSVQYETINPGGGGK